MTRFTARRPAAIFDIDHGRQLHRLRPDLAQGAVEQSRDRLSKASGRGHALDLLWEAGEGKARSGGGRPFEDRETIPVEGPVSGRGGRAVKPGLDRGRRRQISAG